MLYLFVFLVLILLYYLDQQSGKKGRKKEYFALSLPALSLLFLFSAESGWVLRGKSGLCSEAGSNLQTMLLTQALLHRSSPLLANSYTVSNPGRKTHKRGAAVFNFCSSCLSEKHTKGSQEMVQQNFEMNYAFFFVFPLDTSLYHIACIP